ncbi:hypothetical protein APR04_002544 [Promicromonospora umidemergens]|uniref:DUF6879 domain-containing protein n=1 Tax=Promicromonospora umidemergens TaxID=629679 RepID=A0ABP8WU67_9MICO|nr:DUF6879 family protein [Promicromonospora umidemergens]MCP2283636.1 hypothetical protein [Promicromonospora umidemergens]
MQAITGGEFGHYMRTFESSAFRLEQQTGYAVDYEAEQFAAFRAGDVRDPREMPEFAAWLPTVADHVEQGRRISRVRIHQEPPTDYQRWTRYVGHWNVEAGEDIRYATTAQAHRVGLLPDAGPYDWWLLDTVRVLRMTFNDENVCIERHLLTDEASLEHARTWRELAIRAAGG